MNRTTLTLLLVTSLARADESVVIRHRGFEALRLGTPADGGENLYVSRKGRVQTIQRQDFNVDGEIDLLFVNDHNDIYTPDSVIYWGGPDGYRSLLPEMWKLRSMSSFLKYIEESKRSTTLLPSRGGGRSAIVDLNHDEFLDIVFCNSSHNFRTEQPVVIYWGHRSGFDPQNRTLLPAYQANGLAVADLNADGQLEIVVSNQGDERGDTWGFDKHLESFIYWGDANGYNASRRSSVPTISAADVAIGDFDGDNDPDLAFINSNSEEQSAFIYWNDKGTFSEKRRQILPRADLRLTQDSARMKTLHASPLDRDRFDDLVIAGSHNAVIYHGSADGLDLKRTTELPAVNCHAVAAADLNGDERPDLIVGGSGRHGKDPPSSSIFWASSDGYNPKERTELPTLSPGMIDVADMNGDGFADILFGNELDRRGNDVASQIYWGSPNGYAAYHRSELLGFGVRGGGVADFNRDGWLDVFLASGNSAWGPLPSSIFWGNPEHYYSTVSSTLLDVTPHMEYSVADLDDDGFPDLVFLYPGRRPTAISWGSKAGYSSENQTDLPVEGALSNAVADLNRDGFLDIVYGVPGKNQKQPAKTIIVWGNEKRFEEARTTEWELGASLLEASAIADLNHDGHLDLIFPLMYTDYSEIYWGADGGYDPQRKLRLPSDGPGHVVPADLNADGWLDLFFVAGASASRKTVNTQAFLYWGGPAGFSPDRRTTLEGFNCLDATVADFNRDGHLDVAASNYRSDTNRKLPTMIYWGGPDKTFSEKRRSFLKSGSGAAVNALDLNRDGWHELIVSNHQEFFDHAADTDIFWGGPEGFSYNKRTRLPTFGVHLDTMVDAGNVITRRYAWEFDSAPIEAPADASFSHLHWQGETRLGTGLKFQVRSTAKRDQLRLAEWRGPRGPKSFFRATGAPLDGVPAEHRWLQYRAVFTSPDGANSAILTEISLECRRMDGQSKK